MRRAMSIFGCHFLVFFIVLVVSVSGLGYRSLWQDEMETAERGRTIVESGFPLVIDSSGNLSTNVGGREIEEGTVHRYSPWIQFYVAAIGLSLPIENRDRAVRVPFAVAHAATAGVISYGLAELASFSLPVAGATAIALSVQSVRLLYNRSARYHALLDLLLICGMIGVGRSRRKQSGGEPIVTCTIFLLPHVQTLGGSLLSALLSIAYSVSVFTTFDGSTWSDKLRRIAFWAVLPGALSFAALLILIRPWAQEAWGTMNVYDPFRSIKRWCAPLYALEYASIAIILLCVSRSFKHGLSVLVLLVSTLGIIWCLDWHPFSQERYYYSIALLFVLWPILFGTPSHSFMTSKVWTLVTCAVAITPELFTHDFLPFRGLQIVLEDLRNERAGTQQPIREAVDYIKIHGSYGDPVLVDYVPQYVNWYLPGFQIALMPDPTNKTDLNRNNPIWQHPPSMPMWHLWLPTKGVGPWTCINGCDYSVTSVSGSPDRYTLHSKWLHASTQMCIVKRWTTYRYLNAPFDTLNRAAFRPGETADDEMVLGRRCEL